LKLFKPFTADILLAPPTPEAIMPSSRRSQKLPLENSLIPSSTSSTKKSSGKAKADAADKAKADAADKVKADAAARTIVDAAAKANTAGAAAKANCLRNFKRHIIESFKAAKKASPLNQPSRIPIQGR